MEIQLWRELMDPYALAVKEIKVKFKHLINEYHIRGQYSPIEIVEGRVKSITSIMDKMQAKDISMKDIEKKMLDLAGIRLTCQFVEDIDKVVEIIQNRTDMEVVEERDYVRNMKGSGYRSYHIIVSYTVNMMNGPKKLNVEIQIRTMAMDFWATVEHSLQYKYKGNIPEHIQDKLINASEAVGEIDKVMSGVRDEIMDAQNSFRMKENIVKDILNNIMNLYNVTSNMEVSKIQEEFYKVYLLDDLTSLKHFARQLDVIAEGYRAQNLSN